MKKDKTKLCPHCKMSFKPHIRAPHQKVCGNPGCQKRRRSEYHRSRIKTNPDYRETVKDSKKKWRDANPGYMKRYRQAHPEQAERNRITQQLRDQKRRCVHLVKNNSVESVSADKPEVYLFRQKALVKNNSVEQVLPVNMDIYLIASPGLHLVKNNVVHL